MLLVNLVTGTGGANSVIEPGLRELRARLVTLPRAFLDAYEAKLLETTTGDLTIHCSDTLHRAYPPSAHPRKVVYTSFTLPPLPGDEVAANPRYSREARSELTDVQERIAASDNPDAGYRYVPLNS